MKKFFKCTLSVFLVLIMMSSVLPFSVFAEKEPETQNSTETEFSAEGGMGKIINNLTENEKNASFFVSDVRVEGKKATVEYAASADCKMVVAIYNEKTLQMLGSGVADVTMEEKEAEIEININKMPANFLVKVFLLGSTNEALCQTFSNYKYTTVYEEFLEKTPEDYVGEKVIPFNEQADDFGVLEDDVVAPETSTKMTYTYNSDTLTFVFKNAIDDVKKLKVGDVFYYECGDEEYDFILLKVKEITVSGSTVTVVEDENISIEDGFKFLRIDENADFSDVANSDVELGSCLDFATVRTPSRALVDESTTFEPYSNTFEIAYPKAKEDDPQAWDKGIKVDGTFKYSLAGSIRLYYDANWGPDYYEFKVTLNHDITFSISVSGKIELNKDKVGIVIPADFGAFSASVKVYPVVSFEAEINFITVGVNITNEMYVTHDSGGVQKNNNVWTTELAAPDIAKVKLEFKLGLGVEFEFKLGKGVFASASASLAAGARFTAEADTIGLWSDKYHDCAFCLKGDISIFVDGSINLKLQFFKEKWSSEWEVLSCGASWSLTSFYISWNKDGFKLAFGECNRIEQKITVTICDKNGRKLKNATVSTTTGRCDAQGDKKYDDTSMKTDANGQAVFYFRQGEHTVTAIADGYLEESETFKVLAVPKSVSLNLGKTISTLTVNVKNEAGEPLKGATVTAVGDADSDGNDETTTAISDSSGNAKMQLKAATYVVTVSLENYKTEDIIIVYQDSDRTEYVTLKKNAPENGDIIEFGSYPQSRVVDKELLNTFKTITKNWKSYGYYSGDGEIGSMKKGNWMKYADITYAGNKYRAVTFSKIRPDDTCDKASDSGTCNGYEINKVYYFKYEPLKWRVLDASKGLVLSEQLVDSQSYNNTIYNSSPDGYISGSEFYSDASMTIYANDYAKSSIRKWLNDDFYNTAFSDAEKKNILETICDNSSFNSMFSSVTTSDKIFLISEKEATNRNYGFVSASDYMAYGTDYAKIQGLFVGDETNFNGSSWWWLRSPHGYSYAAECVEYDTIALRGDFVSLSIIGVRPALRLNMESISLEVSNVDLESNGAKETNTPNLCGFYLREACVPGNDYILLNVPEYGDDFMITSENILFVNQVTPDEFGRMKVKYIPKTTIQNSIVLLIGDFGYGIEVKEYKLNSYGEQITSLRLLNATAYMEDDNITVLASYNAERTAIYSTTTTGETVKVDMTDKPITVSSSKAYVLKFVDYHKFDNTMRTTMKIGDVEYDLEFVFQFDGEGHSFTSEVIEPTCIMIGFTRHSCQYCSRIYSDNYVAPAGHSYNAVITEPTLTSKGYTTFTCTVCGNIDLGDFVPALGKVNKVSVSDVALGYKSSATLNPDINMSADIDYTVEYESSNESVATVDKNGNITATGTGSAEITITVKDENGNVAKDTCTVTVSYTWWQWLIVIFLFGFIWY